MLFYFCFFVVLIKLLSLEKNFILILNFIFIINFQKHFVFEKFKKNKKYRNSEINKVNRFIILFFIYIHLDIFYEKAIFYRFFIMHLPIL